MILKEISNLIVVDQLNVENAEKYAFFISHPSEDLLISNNFKARVYTSSHIGNIFATIKQDKISTKCFKILRDGEKSVLNLSNGDNLIVTMFKDEEPSRNVLYHFEINSQAAVYLGRFKQISKIIWNKAFLDLVSKGINYLYIDNTNSKSIYHSTEFEICYKLKELLKTHTKIIINTPEFGYESLIKTFVEDFNFKVFIKNDITRNMFYNTPCNGKFIEFKDCEIAMTKDSANLELIERRLESKKFATVRLFDFQKQFENKTYEKFGLYQLSYSSHISQMQMFTLISLIQPQHIKEMYYEFASIPNFIKSASKRWNYVNDEICVVGNSIKDNLNEIENFAPKTQIKNSDQLADFIEETVSESLSNENDKTDESCEKNEKKTDYNFKTDNISEKSTDCEEVYINDTDNLGDKIKAAIPNIPRRRQIREIPIVIDSSPERHQNNKEKLIKNIKTNLENIQSDLEPKITEKNNKNDEFATLMNNTGFSNFPEIEVPDFSLCTNSTPSNNQAKLNNEIIQIDIKKTRETNENYFSFLDNNSLSSKKSICSDVDDEKELLEVCCEKSKNSKQKNNNIPFSNKTSTSENLKKEINKIENSCSLSKQHQLQCKKAITTTVPSPYSKKSSLTEKKDQSKKDSKENNEPLSQLSLHYTLIENVFNGIKNDCQISKNENSLTTELDQNKDLKRNKNSPPMEDEKSKNDKIFKDHKTEIVKKYNPFKKRAFKSDQDDDEDDHNSTKDNIDKTKYKSILKKTKPITPIINIKPNNTNKNNISSNESDKKDKSNLRKSNSSTKRRKSSSSIEEIDDKSQDVIEIIDNSPPPTRRNRRRSIKPIEIKPKRKITRRQLPISQLYIDDDDDDD